MTTITNKKQYPSEQYLNELITNIEFAARAPVEVVSAMAAELQKRREADSAEPVAYIFKHPAGKLFWALTDESNKEQADVIPVYAAPPVPVVSEEKPMPNPLKMYAVDDVAAIAEVRGWNAYRAAMLQSQGEGNPHVTPARLPGGFTIEDAKVLHEDLVRSHISQALSGEKMKKKDRDADLRWIHGVIVQAAWFVKAALKAATGVDALTHAIEGYITRGAWALTDALHIKAIEIIAGALRGSVAGDKDAGEEMALGQYVAGMGFSNVGLGLVHGMAHPLGAFYNTPHGVANAILLPHVMRYNADFTGEKYRDIARVMGVKVEGMSLEEARNAAVEAVFALNRDVGIPPHLRDVGVRKEDIPALAQAALDDVCTGGNPREATLEDIVELYHTAW